MQLSALETQKQDSPDNSTSFLIYLVRGKWALTQTNRCKRTVNKDALHFHVVDVRLLMC